MLQYPVRWSLRLLLSPFLLLILLLSSSSPASAGSYQLILDSAQGSVTYNGSTTPLSSPSYYVDWASGSISYTYTETYDYYWIPSGEWEEPQATSLVVTAGVDISFNATSGGQDHAGSGSCSWSIGGNTASASASYSGPPNGTWSESGTGYRTLTRNVSLAGEKGSITLTYSGSINTDAFGVVVASLAFAPPFLHDPREHVMITSPKPPVSKQKSPSTFSCGGWWDLGYRNTLQNQRFRVRVFVLSGGTEWVKGNPQTFGAGATKGDWSISGISVDNPGTYTLIVKLEESSNYGASYPTVVDTHQITITITN